MRSGVKNIPLDISEETVCKEFTSAAKIISARRRLCHKERKEGKDELIPTYSAIVKFQDQFLPSASRDTFVSFPVLPYISRVLMYFSCLRFGHILTARVLHTVQNAFNRFKIRRVPTPLASSPLLQLRPGTLPILYKMPLVRKSKASLPICGS